MKYFLIFTISLLIISNTYSSISSDDESDLKAKATLYYYLGVQGSVDKSQAFKNFMLAAKLNHPRAQLELADMYASGEGVDKDGYEAAFWYRKAHEGGVKMASFWLASLYANKIIAPTDSEEAKKWSLIAGMQNLPLAQYELGYKYFNGYVFKKDFNKAYFWASLAMINGSTHAPKLLEEIADRLSKEQILKAHEQAFKCYKSNYKNCY